MRMRGLDSNDDWLFGKGQNDYKLGNDALSEDIKTRLKMFLGDCFFATDQGINWFGLLGGKDEVSINLAVSAVILNTQNVTALKQLSLTLDSNRLLTIVYSITSAITGPTVAITSSISHLLTESGDFITTEAGDKIDA